MVGRQELVSLLKCESLKTLSELVQKENSLLIEELWEGPKALLIWLIAEATKKKCPHHQRFHR
jgi:hypothetical protein